MLELNPKHRQEIQESFDRHLKGIADWSVTNVQVEVSIQPVMDYIGQQSLHPGKRTLTYDGYTQSGKRFSLIIDE